jgi:hypothetical protein
MCAAGVLVYCSDYRCSHSMALMADRWPDHARLSDIEPRRGRAAELQVERHPADRRHGVPLMIAQELIP